MAHTPSLFRSLAHAFQIPLRFTRAAPLQTFRPMLTPKAHQAGNTAHVASGAKQRASFSTTAALAAAAKKGGRPPRDRRVTLLRYALHHPTTLQPRPLRFSRLRYLRHWTIQRAWSLYRRQHQTTHLLSLERQHAAMRAACEDLRTECGDVGARLFRQAMTKKGVYGGRSDMGLDGQVGERGRVLKGREGGVPVEYARGLVDNLGVGGWDGGWTR